MRPFGNPMAYRAAAIALVVSQIIGCGSVLDSLPGAGGGTERRGGGSLAPALSSGTISGVAKDSLIRNATVGVYAWNGAKGDLLASGTTDERGRYAVQLKTRSQPLLLEVSGGIYTEEATLKDISLDTGQALYAVLNYTSGQSLTSSITYFTTLATGLAEHLVRLGMKPPDAVREANARLSKVIGVDTGSTIPTDILAPDNFSLPELQYGFATAALSSLTERASLLNGDEPHKVFTSIRFVQTAYDDVRADGLLNGRGVNGEVSFGGIRLNSQIYRHELALHILRIANNKAANRTGRSPVQMFDFARRLNDSTDSLFDGDPIIPIDSDRPNVSAIAAKEFPDLTNGATVFAGLNVSAMVVTFPGAASAQLIVDDQVIGAAIDPENPSVRLETFNPLITDGRHVLKFRVTDISGAVGESPPLDVNVSNERTAIANISINGQFVASRTRVTADIVDPALPQKIEYSVRSQNSAAFIPVATITPDVGTAMLQSSASINLSPESFPVGDAQFKVEVTNSAGFVLSSEVPFVIDRQEPTATLGFDLPRVLPPSPPPGGTVEFPPDPMRPGAFFDKNTGVPCTPMQSTVPTDADPCLLYVRLPFGVTSQVNDDRAIDRVTLTVDGTMMAEPFLPSGSLTTASATFVIDPRNAAADSEKIIAVTAVDKAQNTADVRQSVIFDLTAPAGDFQIARVNGDSGSNVLPGTPVIAGGPVNISALVEDEFGIASAQILANDAPISSASATFTSGTQGSRATLELLKYDTSALPEGNNVFSVRATDRAGNILNKRVIVELDNAGPEINLTALIYPRDQACQVDVTVFDKRLDAVGVRRDDVVGPDPIADTSVENSDTFSFRKVLGGAGGNSRNDLDGPTSGGFTFEARDRFGNVTTRRVTFETPERMSCTLREGGAILLTIPRQR